MNSLKSNLHILEVGSLMDSTLSKLLANYQGAKKIIIVDENTYQFCLNNLITNFDELAQAEIIQLPPGEESKQIEFAANVWEALTEYNITRYDLIINLGGGVITDLGGFIASCYKRGVDFVNIPTSLLGMVDASVGGKTGINLGVYKNQVGVFSNPKAVYVDPSFLTTLPKVELLGGFAEMIKHAVIDSADLFDRVIDQMQNLTNIDAKLISDCIQVKNKVVERDPTEKGERKLLNFGHTIGHAIEGYFIEDENFSHGYCVALGILVESKISLDRGILEAKDYDKIYNSISLHYKLPSFSSNQISKMCELLVNDKKNKNGKILSCLVNGIGDCVYDQEVDEIEFSSALKDLMS